MDWGILLNTTLWAVGVTLLIAGFFKLCMWVEEEYDFPLFHWTLLVVVFVSLVFIITMARMEAKAKSQSAEQVQQ